MSPPASTTPSPSSSSSSTTTTPTAASSNPNPNPNSNSASNSNPIQSWWESISKARASILSLSSLLSLPSLSSLADSDRPASALLSSPSAFSALSSALSSPTSGSGHDPLCQWLYDTYQSSDPDLRLVVLSFIPLLAGLYLSRVIILSSSSKTNTNTTTSLAGFESVLLTIYGSEARSRSGKPILMSIPDLSVPSLYHTPQQQQQRRSSRSQSQSQNPKVGVLSPALEAMVGVKSTKRAGIVGVALECYYRKVGVMPGRSKVDFCESVVCWARQECRCRYEFDGGEEEEEENGEDSSGSCFGEGDGEVEVQRASNSRGCRIPLPWELMQPVLKILGHCLLGPSNGEEVRDAASAAVRSVYARALHELDSRVILASRSLIQLDNSARKAARNASGMVVVGGTSVSNTSTPSKTKRPEVLLASK